MKALQQVVNTILDWRIARASKALALDCGVNEQTASAIIGQVMAGLDKLDDNCLSEAINAVLLPAILELDKQSTDQEFAEREFASLDEPYRSLLSHYHEGMSVSKIAAAWGLSAQDVERYLIKAYSMVRLQMRSAHPPEPR